MQRQKWRTIIQESRRTTTTPHPTPPHTRTRVFAQQNFSQNQLLLKPNLKFKILNTSDYYVRTKPDAV